MLAFACAFTMFAGAASYSDQADIQHTEAVDMLSSLGVLDGYEDGSFRPEATITRAEMAKMIYTIRNGGNDNADQYKSLSTSFTDINGTWAEGYIKYCQVNGIIDGKSTTSFDPNGDVTVVETAKMALVMMGYNASENRANLVGTGWDQRTLALAGDNGLMKDISGSVASAIIRDEAAQLLFNTVDADCVLWSNDKETFVKDTYTVGTHENIYTVGTKYLDLVKDEDVLLQSISYDEVKGTYTLTVYDGNDSYDYTKVAQDYSDLVGQHVNVLHKINKTDEVYGVYAYEDSSVVTTAVVGDIDDKTDKIEIDDTEYKVNGNEVADIPVYDFNVPRSSENLDDLIADASKAAFEVKLIDNTGDGKIDLAVVYPFTVAKVSYVGTDSFNVAANTEMGRDTAVTGIKFDNVTAYDDMAKDDYVKIVAAANTVNEEDTYTKIDVIEGEVTSKSSDGVEIDGNWYDKLDTANVLNLSDTYKIAVVNGYVCAFEAVTSGADVSEYAVVTGAVGASKNGMLGDQAELLFTDGTKKIIDTDKNYSATQDGNNGGNLVGELVTFEIEDDEYELTKADNLTSGTNGTSGFDETVTGGYAYFSSGKSTIGGEFIADDAVIFTYNGSKYDVITGAALKKYANASVTTVNNAFGNKVSTGFNNVVLAYVTVAATVDTQTESYGYVTSNLTTTKNADNETVSKLSMWTTEGQLNDILADSNLSGKVAKGSVVTYEKNDDDSYTIKLANVNRAAILAYNASNGTIRFTGSDLKDNAATNVNGKEVTSDTVILGINSDTKKGVEGVEIATAVETATDDLYQANAYWYSTSGTELDVIVIDTYADLPAMPGALTSDATTQADLQTALNSNTNVTFNADQLAAAASVTAPAGTTLKITDVDDTNKLTVTAESGATIDISALADDATADMLEVVVKPGATFIYDNGTLVGSTGYLTSTGDITVKNAASNTLDVTLTGTVTLKKDLVIGAGDTINATGATIVGDAVGRTIEVRNHSKITGQDSTNFFANGTDANPEAVADGTYVWAADVCTTDGDTVTPGWLKQP